MVRASKVPIYVLLTHEARGPAALVALAADSIFMTSRASIGAGAAMRVKASQYAETLGFLFERRGLDRRLGEALVNREIELDGIVESGELLTLDTDDAVELGVAAAKVDDFDEVLGLLGLEDAEVISLFEEPINTTVMVTNHNWRDIRIYLLRSGARYRLGTVTSMNSATFLIPRECLSPGSRIQVLGEVIGSSEQITTERITVQQGLIIEWVVENALSQSSYFYYVR